MKQPSELEQQRWMTGIDYVRMIEHELGVPPRVILDDCVEIPLYVDGVQQHGVLNKDIDNPTALNQETNPSGSVVNRYQGTTADGIPLPHVVWVAFGRNEIRRDDLTRVRSGVQMIGYNEKTGATAFFESKPEVDEHWITRDETTLRMRGTLPWIDEPDKFNRAFFFSGFECNSCHQSDPFITTPFIDAATLPGTKEPVVPFLDEDSPYHVIGGENWDMRTLQIEGNECLDCHRVGMKTIEVMGRAGYDINKLMPPSDPGSLADDYRQLVEAWVGGIESVEGARWHIPKAGEHEAQTVGEDYGFAADWNTAEQ